MMGLLPSERKEVYKKGLKADYNCQDSRTSPVKIQIIETIARPLHRETYL